MYRNTWLEVDLDALKYNVKTIKERNKKKFIAVVKANGYGSGDGLVSSSAVAAGADMVAVSSLDEALIVRNEGCKTDILILGFVDPVYTNKLIENDITTTVVSLDWVKTLVQSPCAGVKVHLKVDTGMNRIGIKTREELKEALNLLLNAGVKVEGIFTHFACSDDNDAMTQKQFAIFKEAVESLQYDFKWIHCDNSDASWYFKEDFSNACRVGISLYGLSSYTHDLKPVLSLYTQIIHVKTVKQGETVGYGATYTTSSDEIIATIPIGYADGWSRKNQGRRAYVNGTLATFVGRICMDQCMMKMDKIFPVGTTVELFGKHISLDTVAKELDTIPYEVMTLLSDRLTKVYYENGVKVDSVNPRLNRSK